MSSDARDRRCGSEQVPGALEPVVVEVREDRPEVGKRAVHSTTGAGIEAVGGGVRQQIVAEPHAVRSGREDGGVEGAPLVELEVVGRHRQGVGGGRQWCGPAGDGDRSQHVGCDRTERR